MKINNLKVNKKKIKKVILGGAVVLISLTGCEETKNILQDTVLEGASVITLEDGTKDIAVIKEICNEKQTKYNHYYSVISGIYFSNNDCSHNYYYKYGISGKKLYHFDIVQEENITKYLTSSEIEKATEGNLSDKDIAGIISRITEATNDNKLTKTK